MEGSRCIEAEAALQGEISSRQMAAERLCNFIATFLGSMLRHEGPQPCRLIFREIFGGASREHEMFEALVSSTVNDFIRPTDSALISVLEHLSAGKHDRVALEMCAQSIIGQCAFYLTHAPFILRLRGINPAESPHFEETIRHISTFSLRAMGCEEEMIQLALSSIPKEQSPSYKAAV